jgi:hypothetical protein
MAPLKPDLRVAQAAHFRLTRPLADRLRLSTGVVLDPGGIFPRDDWRPPSADELALLTAPDGDADALVLFSIPEHLHRLWWEVAAAEGTDVDMSGPAFQSFAAELLAFLRFKQLPMPPVCALEVVLTPPGQPSTRPGMGGLLAEQPFAGMLGAVNLGDEESALVFLNHSPAQRFTPVGDYRLVKVALGPGEGYWLPPGRIIHDGDTRGCSEIDVQLVLRTA